MELYRKRMIGLWLEGDIAIMKRCDVVVAMSTWEKSTGAKAEIELAARLGIEIIFDNGETQSQ
jgi:hypothetical protein